MSAVKLDDVRRVISAAEKKAREIGQPMNIAVARINEAPYQTNVYLVDSTAPPAGVGEPGVPPFIAALCNAVYVATGKRVRELPLSRTKLGR